MSSPICPRKGRKFSAPCPTGDVEGRCAAPEVRARGSRTRSARLRGRWPPGLQKRDWRYYGLKKVQKTTPANLAGVRPRPACPAGEAVRPLDRGALYDLCPDPG